MEIIVDLYKYNESVETGLSFMVLGDAYGNVLLQEYKKKLDKIFDPANRVRKRFSLKDAKKVLSDFINVCEGDGDRWYGDLALYFAKCATEYTVSFGDMNKSFYQALIDAYEDAVAVASSDEKLYKQWKYRLESILKASYNIGWSVDMYISEIYDSIPWIEEDEHGNY